MSDHPTWRLAIVSLFLALAFVQIIHLLLMGHVKGSNKSSDQSANANSSQIDLANAIADRLARATHCLREPIKIDSSGRYRIFPGFLLSERDSALTQQQESIFGARGITLVTACTLEALPNLYTLSRVWSGPMSVSLYIPSEKDVPKAIIELLNLVRCSDWFRTFATVHAVFPFRSFIDRLFRSPVLQRLQVTSALGISCQELTFEWHQRSLLFPGNETLVFSQDSSASPAPAFLYNFATRQSRTRYVLRAHINMLPSLELRSAFLAVCQRLNCFAKGDNETSSSFLPAFMLPVFELSLHASHFPLTPGKLLKQLPSGQEGPFRLVRPFLWKACPNCQEGVNHTNLLIVPPDGSRQQELTYPIETERLWHPYIILDRDVPPLNEYLSFHDSHKVQICGMESAGYAFKMLRGAFLLYKRYTNGLELPRGAKEKTTAEPSWQQVQPRCHNFTTS